MGVPGPQGLASARGVVRLLTTAGGRVLCLAGAVDATVVEDFLRRYGREPARIDGIDAGSVTVLSTPGLQLILDHLEAARRAGRPVTLRPAAWGGAAQTRPSCCASRCSPAIASR